MPFIACLYLAAVLAAFLSSLITFRLDLPFHLKLFSYLLWLTFPVEVLSAYLIYFAHKSNVWLYNIFTLPEFWLYGYYYLLMIHQPRLRIILKIFLVIFPIFWGITVFLVFGFNVWNSYVIILGSFFSVVFSLMYYYRLIIDPEIYPLRNLPEFWIASGMLIFYLGALPYFGTLNFLIRSHMHVAVTLSKVLTLLNTCMYTFFSYAYLCRMINIKKSS
jgi:hypothetical protein